ncbi:MAG: hypothetical protein EA411_03780 [Saprospirales bacterium]|nr:MAG: hypothetical protein EA411_03780 [Saprospirales bacterium]
MYFQQAVEWLVATFFEKFKPVLHLPNYCWEVKTIGIFVVEVVIAAKNGGLNWYPPGRLLKQVNK